MSEIEYVNPQLKNISKKALSIQVSLNGFSFLISSMELGNTLHFKRITFSKVLLIDELIRKIEEYISSEKVLQEKFESTRVCFFTQKSTLVPEEYFDRTKLKSYFEFNHSLNELDELHYEYLPDIKAYNLFSVPGYLGNTLYNTFNAVKFTHQASFLINYGTNLSFGHNNIVLGINSSFFDICIFQKNQLLLHNSFQYTNELDFIYFFLYPLTQLKIDRESANVFLFGESVTDTLEKEIKKNVGSVMFPTLESSLPNKVLSRVKKHEIYSLLLKK